MAFRKPGRPFYYVSPTLPGFGRVGPWSTGATSKRLADAIEAWLRQTALSDPEAVRGIVAGKYTLREAYVAGREGKLDGLRADVSDAPIHAAIRDYEKTQTDRRKLDGLSQLRAMTDKGQRLSWLTEPKNIAGLLTKSRNEGRRTNSVHRSLYAAIKGLLAFEYGDARKREITADVKFSYEDDTRHIDVSPEQVAELLAACDRQMYGIAVAAMLTGVDRGPLLRLTPSSFDFERQTMRVHDTKAASRHRVLELDDEAAAHFRILVANTASATDPIFRLRPKQVDKRWQRVKKDTGLDVRFKDLRHVFSNAWIDEGGSLNDLGQVLGHSRSSTTLRYTARQARESKERMGRVAERLGLKRHRLRAVQGGE